MLCVISFLMHFSLQMIYSGALSSHVIMVKKPLPAGKYDCKKHRNYTVTYICEYNSVFNLQTLANLIHVLHEIG